MDHRTDALHQQSLVVFLKSSLTGAPPHVSGLAGRAWAATAPGLVGSLGLLFWLFPLGLLCLSSLLQALSPQFPDLGQRGEGPWAPGPSAGLSLTFAALAPAKQQARPRTTSPRRPMASVCLQVALPPRPGYLWNWSQGQCVRSTLSGSRGHLSGRAAPRAWLVPAVHLCRLLPPGNKGRWHRGAARPGLAGCWAPCTPVHLPEGGVPFREVPACSLAQPQ